MLQNALAIQNASLRRDNSKLHKDAELFREKQDDLQHELKVSKKSLKELGEKHNELKAENTFLKDLAKKEE